MIRHEITFQDAWAAWSAHAPSVGGSGRHIPPATLYELLIQPPEPSTTEPLLRHLTRCPVCLQELQALAQSLREAEGWDAALPKAAASEMRGPVRIPTEGGKYTIIIRRSVADERRGVMTVEVAAPYRAQLEGQRVTVRDGQGRLLVRGRIVDGEVSQAVENLAGLIPRFLVEPE